MHFRPRKAHGITRSHALNAQSQPQPRRSRRARLLRLGLWLLVLGALLVTTLALGLYYRAWSFPWLDERLQAQWIKATGLPLTYERAVFQPRSGSVEIINPRILDDQGQRTLLDASRISLHIPLGQFLSGKRPYHIRSIDIDASLTLPVILGEKRVSFGESLDQVISALTQRQKERRERRATSSTVVLDSLSIRSVAVQLARERGGVRQQLLQVDRARILADLAGAAVPKRIIVDGRWNPESPEDPAERPVRLVAIPSRDRQAVDLNLRIAQLDSLHDLPWRSPYDFKAAALEVAARVRRADPAHYAVSGSSVVRDLKLIGTEALGMQPLGDVTTRLNLTLDRTTGQLDLTSGSLASRICALQTSGSVSLRAPYAYALNIRRLQAQGVALALLAEAAGRGSEIVRPADAALDLSAVLRGGLSRRVPDAVSGRIELAGLNLNSPELPPLHNMRLNATLTTAALNIQSAQAVVQGMPVAFNGAIVGRPLFREIRSADIQWKANGDLISVSSIIQSSTAPQGPSAGLHLNGKVAGEGRFRVREPLAKGSLASVLERSRLEGRLDLSDVTIRHPRLMAPVRNLTGRIDLVGNEARITRGSGEWMGFSFKLSGGMKGKQILWKNPRLNLTGSADFELAETRQRLAKASPELRERLDRLPPLAGQSDLDFTLDAEAGKWAGASFNATLNLKDFATELKPVDTPKMAVVAASPLRLREVQLALTPVLFEVKRARGRWGALDVALEGKLTPGGGAAALKLDGALAELARRVPLLARFFRLGGEAGLQAEFKLAPRKGFAPPATWQALFASLPQTQQGQPAGWRAWAARRWALDGGGVINARDAEWTYAPMPARLWGITGPVRFDMDHLWTPDPLPIRGGDRSHDCYGTIDLAYGTNLNDLLQGRPRRTTQLDWVVTRGHVALEEWLTQWKFKRREPSPSAPPGAPLPYSNTVPVFFRMRGVLDTPSAAYRGVMMNRFRCKLDLDVTPSGYSNYFAWRDIAARIGAGDFMVEGTLVSGDLVSNVIVNSVELDPLMKGLTGQDHVNGIFSGKLSGRMQLHQGWGPKESPPLEGSGAFRIIESRFVSNKIFNSLGGILKLPLFENISFSTIEGPFEFRGERYTTKGVVFDNPTLVHLNVVGAYGPQKKLDMQLQLQLLPKAIGRIPLVGEALQLFNKLVGKVLRFELRGTSDNPAVRLL